MEAIQLTRDPHWADECVGYHVQGMLSSGSINAIVALQQKLNNVGEARFHLIPAESLHISVFTLVSARTNLPNKDKIYEQICAEMPAELAELSRFRGSIDVDFDEVLMAPMAIGIATRHQPVLILELRERFSNLLQRLGFDVPKYDRTHITIARPAADWLMDVADQAMLAALFNKVSGQITAIKCVRETRYPSLEIENLSV
jgi:hypothetical protein